MNNYQNEPINILDVGNYIVEKTRDYPFFLPANNKKERENPKRGLFMLDNYKLSLIVYYVYVTSVKKRKPLFSNEHLYASYYGTIFPKIIENYNMPDGYYIEKGSPNGDSQNLNLETKKETKKNIDEIIERINKMKWSRELIDINRQQRAYFKAIYPKKEMEEKMKDYFVNNEFVIDQLKFQEINNPMKKQITDELILECFENKQDIFSIDEDCRYECSPDRFNPSTGYYFPKGLRIISSFTTGGAIYKKNKE
ncbi:hypothetical protein [Candidatus Phytoplasma sp. AldY-WA1]|uniref:hypothetical protein n=1 Tax=Candidatus Phytoplasma sp. AldY-WA1 TaxID=2852100 RepID=UPI0025509453|nr:hypothetical protein [Candidatus Phytoplasma sp. AldY-WA1]